jgi:orotate phosphoribosyltransferase
MYDTNEETSAERFLRYAIEIGALELFAEGNERKLKSGRLSPYFFNSALFTTGEALRELATAYADRLRNSLTPSKIDVVFGPSYKGTFLVGPIVMLLSTHFRMEYASNRKEAKDHGEGGIILGASLKDKRVLLVDDVMTSGQSCEEAVNIIKSEGGTVVECMICLDREERGKDSELSATQEFTKKFGIPVHPAATLTDLISLIERLLSQDTVHQRILPAGILTRILDYKAQYGVD